MPILGIIASSEKNVPNAPTIGTATDIGTGRAYNNGAASVTFTAPSFNGKLPITSYTVTSSPGGFTASGASSPLTVAGLQSSTSYTFTVTATNAIGTSAPSGATASITATTVPQAPTIGTATAGNGSATVTYTANATGGKAVSAYTATSSPGSVTGTGASPITVSGLTNGTAYTFTVTATNANGTSAASAASNSVTPASPLAFDSIATFTSPGGVATTTFSSIPSTYKSLQLRFTLRDGIGLFPQIRFNGDTSSIYASSNNMSITSPSNVIGTSTSTTTQTAIGTIALGTSAASHLAPTIVDILDYASTSKNKTVTSFTGNTADVRVIAGEYVSTSAINSITVFIGASSWVSGSTIALYGVK